MSELKKTRLLCDWLGEVLTIYWKALDVYSPHDGPEDCPLYYDRCWCSLETLDFNIERADTAERQRDAAQKLLRVELRNHVTDTRQGMRFADQRDHHRDTLRTLWTSPSFRDVYGGFIRQHEPWLMKENDG